MPFYNVFGGCLRSDVEFPELPLCAPRAPDWTFRCTTGFAPLRQLSLIGQEEVNPGVQVRLFRSAQGFTLLYDDTGRFEVSSDGTTIDWCPHGDAPLDSIRADVLGRVFATALYASGQLCLHGSAVALAQGSIGFVAPKYHGKSTIAAALAKAGARIVTDDTIPVETGAMTRLRPGVLGLRLWQDAFDRLAGGSQSPRPDGKFLVGVDGSRALESELTPLSAIYLLVPVVADATGDVVRRRQLSSIEAALVLAGHAKIGGLLGGSERPTLLGQAVEVARTTPVYVLHVARDLEQIDRVAQELLQWHGGVPESELSRIAC